MAGYGGMGGITDTTVKKKKWVPPDRQPINQQGDTTKPEDKSPLMDMGGPSGMSQDVINQMMSGSAFDPYRQMSQEAMARSEANRRALTSGKIAQSGQVGQGMAGQIAGATEQDILGRRFDTMLNTEMAQQQMKERGVGMYQRGRGLEADIAYKEAGLGLEKERIGEMGEERAMRERLGEREIGSRERMAAAQEKGAMSRFGRELTSREKMHGESLEEQRLGRESLENYRGRQLDLAGEELGLKREMFESDDEFRDRVQQWKEEYGAQEMGLKEKEAETHRLQQMANAAYQKGQLDLGWGTLDFQKMSFQQRQDLAEDAQEWLEQYQQGTLDLAQLQYEIDKKYKEHIIESDKEKTEREKEKDKKKEEMKWVRDENGNWIQVPKYPQY